MARCPPFRTIHCDGCRLPCIGHEERSLRCRYTGRCSILCSSSSCLLVQTHTHIFGGATVSTELHRAMRVQKQIQHPQQAQRPSMPVAISNASPRPHPNAPESCGRGAPHKAHLLLPHRRALLPKARISLRLARRTRLPLSNGERTGAACLQWPCPRG